MKWIEEIEDIDGPRPGCCWCGKELSQIHPYILPVGLKEGAETPTVEDNPCQVSIPFPKGEDVKLVSAIVTGKDSEVKRDGVDLLFLTCSKTVCRECPANTVS